MRAYRHVKGVGKVLADVPRRPSRVRFEEKHCECFSGIKEETNVAEISEGHIGSSRWRCVHGKANRGSICCDCDTLRRPSRILETHRNIRHRHIRVCLLDKKVCKLCEGDRKQKDPRQLSSET